MALTPLQAAASIAVMAAVTFLTRFIPFLLFDRPGKVPHIVLYLGRVLPPAIIMMLVIYCLRGISFSSDSHGIRSLCAWPWRRRCTGGKATTCCPSFRPRSSI